MNRTDRLYAIVEELRAVSPRPRSATWLANRFEVSTRTVERDLDSLRQAGVPLYAHNGRRGGYVVDTAHTLPPLGITADEALAIMVALSGLVNSPLAKEGRSARQKILATLPKPVRDRQRALSEQIALVGDPMGGSAVTALLNEGLAREQVIRLRYRGGAGHLTCRVVEPMGWVKARDVDRWYLVAWCRLREGVRGFRVDRIIAAEVLPEAVRQRHADLEAELARIGARLFSEVDDSS
ncbi:helix-turn-helix transcriptional regulator [Mycobacterium sp. WMMD1722]|uniref:helix-turn-helix transcriptional regulator n=1 Tax=Mycobacterium sp. WMMD1722 TaxID=3404117 RepID=UPI003BF596B5